MKENIINDNKSIPAPEKYSCALDRVNVKRLIKYIKNHMEDSLAQTLFEPNDKSTRMLVAFKMCSLLDSLLAKRLINDYNVICDESNNTPYNIDNGDLIVDICFKQKSLSDIVHIRGMVGNKQAYNIDNVDPDPSVIDFINAYDRAKKHTENM